jgi:hypothetical protein
VDRWISVADMRELGWGELEVASSSVSVGGGVGWRCLLLLSHVHLSVDTVDLWQ